MPYSKREDRNTYWDKWYAQNRERHKKHNVIAAQKRREELRKLGAERKSKPCLDCGGSFPHYVMQFDHVPERGQKFMDVADMINHCYGMKKILEEMDKCDVVCANCHAVRTHNRKLAPVVGSPDSAS